MNMVASSIFLRELILFQFLKLHRQIKKLYIACMHVLYSCVPLRKNLQMHVKMVHALFNHQNIVIYQIEKYIPLLVSNCALVQFICMPCAFNRQAV